MDLIPYAIPFFLLLMGLELAYGFWRGRNTYRVNDSVSSLFMGSLRTASKLVVLNIGGIVFASIENEHALFHMPIDSPWTWLITLLLYDFCYYWDHRIAHERSILWASHVAHHQSEEFNLSTALRQTSTSFLLTWVWYVPMFFLGVPIYVFVTVASAHLIYQYWVHTEHIPKLGPLEWVLITPSNHRVHHAQNAIYVDKNYGGLLIIWDRLFGTYQEELDDERPVYGILGPLHSWNPLWANLHIYVGMIQDCWRTERWQDKLKIWVSRTGWRPDDVARDYPRPKSDLSNFSKYDPAVAAWVNRYALAQLAVIVFVGSALVAVPVDSYLFNFCGVLALLATMVTTSGWLQSSDGVYRFEMLRLVALAVLAVVSLAGPFAWICLPTLGYVLLNFVYLHTRAERVPSLAA